jgi:hypothetical protein
MRKRFGSSDEGLKIKPALRPTEEKVSWWALDHGLGDYLRRWFAQNPTG